MTTNAFNELAGLIQGEDAQKLVHLSTEEVPGIEPGIAVLGATTKDRGLQVETIDLRRFIPGVLASAEAGTRLVTDVPSFLAELDRYSIDPNYSTLWGDETRGRVEAIYNDHNHDFGAGLRDNRLRLELRADADWVAWHELSGKYLRQEEFGDAVEELLHTVVEPSQALMEVIDSIRATSKGTFESRISRADGGQQLEYREDVTATAGKAGRLDVPKMVTLALRPWEGLDTYKVEGWFRLRVQNGQLALAIKLKPTRTVLRSAWDDVIADIEGHLDGKPVLATRFG